MEERILRILGDSRVVPLNVEELTERLGLPEARRFEVSAALKRLERAGQVARIKKDDRYALPAEADLVPGRIRMNRQGGGRLQPADPRLGAISIPPEATGTAIHGDRVLVRREIMPWRRGAAAQPQPIGRVVRILERARSRIVGTLQRSRQFYYVIPDDPRMPQDIYVPPPRDVGRLAQPGEKVVVELSEWQNRHTNPEGEVIELLGSPEEEGVDMLSVIRQYQLPLHFPKNVLGQARSFGNEVRPADLQGRLDCRTQMVVTVDPDDAKDFDDAICLERSERDGWKLWVHIADVSHYVKPGSALDEEAAARGNSTYLVDRVIPMLPEALSNELCSLKPHVDRLTKCVEFILAADGRVLQTRFHSAVIRSQRRFNYREVLALLRRPPTDAIERMLHQANELAQKLRRARFKAGSLDLDFPESKILLDEDGRVSRIEKVENDISHQLIEEFMLLANEAVAARLKSLRRPSIYRIHEAPDEGKLQEFREEVLGHGISCGNLTNRHEVQRLLERLNLLPVGPALKIGLLRSLMRARYAVESLGHYGLAKVNYTHFTSPIRRYADLVVHRSLFEPASVRPDQLQEVADHISETERNSGDAERDSRDVKLFAFLKSQLTSGVLQSYSALVTYLRNFGFFVDVPELGLSGLVHLSGMNDDLYVLDSQRMQLIGRRTRRVIRMGDRVTVQVAKVDTLKRQVDFALALPIVTRGLAARKATLPDRRPHQRGRRPAGREARREADAHEHGDRPHHRRDSDARLSGRPDRARKRDAGTQSRNHHRRPRR